MIAYGPEYSEEYYRDNGQSGDRPALRWYTRLVRRYCGVGPYLDFGCGTGHLLRRLAALGPAADPTHVNLKPHARWRKLLVAHGFTVVREGTDGLWNVPYGRLPGPWDLVRAAPAFAQYVAGRLVLPAGSGESSVFVVERSGED